jgi:hypothetical protein
LQNNVGERTMRKPPVSIHFISITFMICSGFINGSEVNIKNGERLRMKHSREYDEALDDPLNSSKLNSFLLYSTAAIVTGRKEQKLNVQADFKTISSSSSAEHYN